MNKLEFLNQNGGCLREHETVIRAWQGTLNTRVATDTSVYWSYLLSWARSTQSTWTHLTMQMTSKEICLSVQPTFEVMSWSDDIEERNNSFDIFAWIVDDMSWTGSNSRWSIRLEGRNSDDRHEPISNFKPLQWLLIPRWIVFNASLMTWRRPIFPFKAPQDLLGSPPCEVITSCNRITFLLINALLFLTLSPLWFVRIRCPSVHYASNFSVWAIPDAM